MPTGYKMIRPDHCSTQGCEGPWVVGETRVCGGVIKLCECGYHWSPTAYDAMVNIDEPILMDVDASDPTAMLISDHVGTKMVSWRMECLRIRDITRPVLMLVADGLVRAAPRLEWLDKIKPSQARLMVKYSEDILWALREMSVGPIKNDRLARVEYRYMQDLLVDTRGWLFHEKGIKGIESLNGDYDGNSIVRRMMRAAFRLEIVAQDYGYHMGLGSTPSESEAIGRDAEVATLKENLAQMIEKYGEDVN